jgi:HPt (histidine-containing phosphotransfer) domain-containing protein
MMDAQKNNLPLDLSYLRDMSGDSPEFIIEMIEMFKTQTPIYIAEMEVALQARDWAKVSSAAHKIKPTFAYVGREDAKDFMQTIEHDARELRNVEALPAAFQQVQEFLVVLYRQLDEARAELEKRL